MKRRPVLELDANFSSKESSTPVINNFVVTAPVLQSLSSYGDDDDTDTSVLYPNANPGEVVQPVAYGTKPYTPWQMCVDKNTGYTYYWNVQTNQVTWEIPPEYAAYEVALQQYQMVQTVPPVNEIHPLTKHKIARTTQEVVANRNAPIKKANVEVKLNKTDNGQIGLVPYGPTWEDDGSEDAEARKLASAKRRLLSYKSDKLKQKSEDADGVVAPPGTFTPPPAPTTKNETASCKIPFVPTLDEIKEHPIFSNFTLPQNFNNSGTDATQISVPPVTQYVAPKMPRLVAEHYSDSEEECEDDEDEHLDDVIITRLRKKALMLKQLGGDVPKEIISVLDDSKTAKDIIAEIEKEIPPDANDDDSLVEMDIDTDDETEKSTLKEQPPPKPLFPILDFVKETEENKEPKPAPRSAPITRKTQMKNIQKIKLSARAKELIKTSLLTAKARATNFVETADGLKPAEEVLKVDKAKEKLSINGSGTSLNQVEPIQDRLESPEERRRREELKRFKSEIDTLCSPSTKEAESAPVGASAKTNFAHPGFIVGGTESEGNGGNQFPKVPLPASSEESTPKQNKADTKITKSEPLEEKDKENMFNFQCSFVIPIAKRSKAAVDEAEAKKVSLVSKCEEFLQSVKKNVAENEAKKKSIAKEEEKKRNAPGDICIGDVLNTKQDEDRNVMDLSQLVMEKLKFLNDGKTAVTPVQVMAIQIETLIGAWQSKALTTKYLQEWLDGSAVHLKSIEEAAAPQGWQCEWDRSYGRYYYRNKLTGTIQWNFPKSAASSSKKRHRNSEEKSSSRRPRTPPPPSISESMVPPPPPIISDLDTRESRPSPDRRRSPPLPSALPPLPVLPPKPPTPPPPPPSEPSLPPPPPPAVSEAAPDTPVFEGPELPSSTAIKKPVIGLHDELNSFYSDIASLEATFSQNGNDGNEEPVQTLPIVVQESAIVPKVEEKPTKKKKKVKLDSSLSLKKKGLEGLVAKWQKVSSDI